MSHRQVKNTGEVGEEEGVGGEEEEVLENPLDVPTSEPTSSTPLTSSSADLSSPLPPTSEPPYRTCEVCGWAKGKSWFSLKMHQLQAHGGPTERVKAALEATRKAKSSPRESRAAEKPRSLEKIVEAGELPEEYDYLQSMLEGWGVRNAGPICDLMSKLDWDNFEALAQYCELSGVRKDRVSLVLEGWSKHLGIAIPEDLASRLKVPQYESEYGDSYGYGRRIFRRDKHDGRGTQDEVSTKIEQMYDEGRKLALVRAMYGPDEEENEQVKSLVSQVRQLSEKLEQEKETRHQNEMEAIKTEMNLRIGALEKNQGEFWSRKLAESAEGIGTEVKEWSGMAKSMVVGLAKHRGVYGEDEYKPNKRIVASGVSSLIPGEYLEVE